jgi:hypothetical protein
MTAREYLQQLQKLNMLINQKTNELEDLHALSTSVSGVDYSKDRVQTSTSADAPFVKIINKIITIDEEVKEEIDSLARKKHKIINQIQALNNPKYIEILYKHYVEFKRLEVVAVEMNYSIRNIYFIHRKALQIFQSKYLTKSKK